MARRRKSLTFLGIDGIGRVIWESPADSGRFEEVRRGGGLVMYDVPVMSDIELPCG